MSTDYPFEEIITRARSGRSAIYPYKDQISRFSVFGADLHAQARRFHTFDDLIISAPQFTPQRLEKAYELIFREPFFRDVDTSTEIGGFRTTLPVVQASMGSPEDWNIIAPLSAKACAILGLIYGIGENVASTWGYDKRNVSSQPCFMERILTYFEHQHDGLGGVVIQQNEEDAQNELWNKVYSDPRLAPYIEQGLVAFEIKGGQGAKSGIGGEKIVDQETAKRLKDKGYIIHPDPDEVEQEVYERHSAPDIFTKEILTNRIKKLQNDYPRVRIWFKSGPYRDLVSVIKTVSEAGVDAMTIDGKEGGTGMSPTTALQQLGIPTLGCLSAIKLAREEGITLPIILSGRIYEGSQVVKALALGATAVALGRPFLIAANAYPLAQLFIGKEFYKIALLKRFARLIYKPSDRSIDFIQNYIETLKLEIQLLTSSLGKYSMDRLDKEDIQALDPSIAISFDIDYAYDFTKSRIKEMISTTPLVDHYQKN